MTGTLAHAQEGEVIPGAKVVQLEPTQMQDSDPRLALEGKLPPRVLIHPAGAMKQEDKDLAASAATAIKHRAGFLELGFDEGDWKESQLDCPAFPQHLLLRFTRDNGAGDQSTFTASIPRGKDGQVRVIPILRRGYSLYSLAPVSKATISAFNEIESEEHIGDKADWSSIGLCYAALSAPRWIELEGNTALTLLGSTMLRLGEKGGVTVGFGLGAPAPGQWQVTFNKNGQVQGTEFTSIGDVIARPMPATLTEMRGKPLPASIPVGPGRPIPSGPEPRGRPIPPTSSGDSQSKPQ